MRSVRTPVASHTSVIVHSLGLFDHYGIYNVPSGNDADSPNNQWDVNQAYVDFAIPVGTGLRPARDCAAVLASS